MTITTEPPTTYDFGPFRLDPDERLLLRDGQPIPLPPKAYDLLVSLVAHAGRLRTKEDLLKEVWRGTFVDEANLSYTVSLLRKALDDDTEPHGYIETVPKRGYRFKKLVIVAAPPGRRRRLSGSKIAAVVVIVVIACASLLWLAARRRNDSRPVRSEIVSVAILPLKNLSNDAAQVYFAEGMHEAVITELARLGTPVVARSSAMGYEGTSKPLATIARELNVQAIVEGSVLRNGAQVRISVQLVEAATGQTLWGAAFDRHLQDVLALHRDVAQAIAAQVRSAVRQGRPQRAAGSVDPETFEAYLKGRYHLNRRRDEDLVKAVEYFERAIRRDPGNALAFAGLADSLNVMPQYGSTAPRDAIPQARRAAAQSIALDDSLAEGHTSLAWALLTYDWDWAAADREFKRAIDLNPNYETARLWYGLSLTWRGRFEEGAAQLQKGRMLDPVGRAMISNIAIASYLARDYDRSIRESAALIELDNTYPAGPVWRGLAQLQKGLHSEAVSSLEQGLAYGPAPANRLARAGYVYGVTGQKAEARTILARLGNLSRTKYVSAVNFAIVHLGLGEKAKALEWLDRGIDEHATEMMLINTDPRFDLLRSEPRFQRLLQIMNFPPPTTSALGSSARSTQAR